MKKAQYNDGWTPFKDSEQKGEEGDERQIPDGLTPQQFWDKCAQDRRYYFKHCLRIRVKNYDTGKNEMVPFILNDEQQEVLKYIESQERKKEPVRIIILKSRKIGFSTLIEAIGHHMCQFNQHIIAKCVAHRKESTEDIFEIAHRFQKYLHPAVAEIAEGKSRRSSRDMGLYWNHNSRFEVQTQGATDAERGDTPDYLHLSELGLWWKRRKSSSDSDVLQATMGSIEPAFGTYVIIESTACGAAGAFYERFWGAWKRERGNLFRAFFFGWQDHKKYSKLPKPGERALDRALRKAYKEENEAEFWRISEKLGYDARWAERAIRFKLYPWQIRWAFQSVQTKFGGKVKDFDTEFPLSPEIAFTSSANSPFNQDAVRKQIVSLRDEPVSSKQYGSIVWNKRTREASWKAGTPKWMVWHEPEPGHEYIVTVDSAHGIDDGDFTCIQVGDRTDRKQCAELYARIPPDETAVQAFAVGMHYNEALLAPEIDGPGLATTQNLLEMDDGAGYANLYVRSRSGNWTQRFGFRTGTKSIRDACVAALAKVLLHRTWDIYSSTLLKECQTFIESGTGKCEAMPGEHDDAVMAKAIMMYIDTELGEWEQKLPPPSAKPLNSHPLIAALLQSQYDETDPHLGGQF